MGGLRRIKSKFCEIFSAVSVKVWEEMMLIFSCVPLLWWQGKEVQTRFCSLASFLAACYHLPVLDYFYPLYQPLDPQMLQEHKELQLFSWLPRGLLMSWTAPWPHLAPTQPGFHWPQEELDQILIGYWEDKLGLIPAVVYNMPFHHKMKGEVKLILTIHWILTPVHLFCSPPFLMPSLSMALIHIFFKTAHLLLSNW